MSERDEKPKIIQLKDGLCACDWKDELMSAFQQDVSSGLGSRVSVIKLVDEDGMNLYARCGVWGCGAEINIGDLSLDLRSKVISGGELVNCANCPKRS